MKKYSERSIGLCDCNNFFVSCERREDPSLVSRPVVVLSGNDGCIVSRSEEVKAAGVAMGEPYFKARGVLEHIGAAVLSGRLGLYNKISSEVMACLSRFTDTMEVYSIDEAFINLAIASVEDAEAYCRAIRAEIWRRCGIPVSLGISSTKTLAKLASHVAKKSRAGVFWLDAAHRDDAAWMGAFPAGEVWGVGRRTAAKLALRGRVNTAAELMRADDLWLKENFSINTLYTAWELRGFPAYPLAANHGAAKSVQVSRSFGEPVYSFDELLDAVSYFTICAARQLRGMKQRASRMGLYLRTSPFHMENFYSRFEECSFREPRSLDADFLAAARGLLSRVFEAGRPYKKAGVLLSGFTDVSCGVQGLLFDGEESGSPAAHRAAETADALNAEFGRVVIAPADNFTAPEKSARWHPRREHSAAADDARGRPALPLGPKRRVNF